MTDYNAMIDLSVTRSYLDDLLPTGKQSKLYGESIYIHTGVMGDDKEARQFCKTFGFVLASNPANADHVMHNLPRMRAKLFGYLLVKMGAVLAQGIDSLDISLYPSGDVQYIKTLDSDGKPHSAHNNPASIYLRPNGSIEIIDYVNHGELHRENNLPARVWFFEDSEKIMMTEYWLKGGPARIPPDQPAKIVFNKDGSAKSTLFAVNGEWLSKDDGLAMVKDYKRRVQAHREVIANMGYVQPSTGVLPI